MTNDFLVNGGNDSLNGKPQVTGVNQATRTDLGSLPDPYRASPNFVPSNHTIINGNNEINLPGFGTYPSLTEDTLAKMGIVNDPLSLTAFGKSGQDVNGGVDTRTVAERLADAESKRNGKPTETNSEYEGLRLFAKEYGKGVGERQTSVVASDYENYMGGVRLDQDFEDIRAINQTGLEQARHGIYRFAGTTVQAFAEPFVNLAAIPLVLTDKGLSGIYDNATTRKMDELNDALKEWAPIYSTKAQQESGAFSSTNLSSGAFWWDRALGGAAFTAGTLLNAMVVGGAIGKLTTTLAQGAAKARLAKTIGDVSRNLSGLTGDVETLTTVGETLNDGSRLIRAAKGITDVSKSAANFMAKNAASYIAASAEGGVEARDMGRQLKIILDEQVANGEITQAKADADLKKAMNNVYLLNVGIVGMSTHAQFGGMISRMGREASDVAAVGLARGVNEAGKRTIGKFTPKTIASTLGVDEASRFGKFLKMYSYSHPIVSNILTEAGEEASQFVVAGAAKEYYGRHVGRNYGESLINSADELFGSKEGRESMLIGGLMGALGSGIRYKSFINEHAHNQQVADFVNNMVNGPSSRIKPAMEHYGKVVLNNEMAVTEQISPNADAETLSIIDNAYLTDIASYAHKTGTTEVMKEYLEDFNNLSKEEFDKEFPTLSNMNDTQRKETINKMVNNFRDLTNLRQSVDERFGALDGYVRDYIYDTMSFHRDTKELYNRQIETLRTGFDIDINAITKESIAKYEKDKLNYHEAEKRKAYQAYKNSLIEGAKGDDAGVFGDRYDAEHKEENLKAYDNSIVTKVDKVTFDEVTKKKEIKSEPELGNIGQYIRDLTNKAVEDKIGKDILTNSDISEDSMNNAVTSFDNYKNLQNAYLKTERLLRYIVDPNNQEKIKKGYVETHEKLATKEAQKFVSKAYNETMTAIDKGNAVNEPEVTKKFNEVAGIFKDKLTEIDQTLRNQNLSAGEEAALRKEKAVIKSHLDAMTKNYTKFKDKFGKSDVVDSNEASTVEPVSTEESTEKKPEVKPEESNAVSKEVEKKIDEIDFIIEDVLRVHRRIDNGMLKYTNNDIMQELAENRKAFDVLRERAQTDNLDQIDNILEGLRVVEYKANAIEQKLIDNRNKERAAQTVANGVEPSGTSMIFDVSVIEDKLGITPDENATVESKMNKVVDLFNQLVPGVDRTADPDKKGTIENEGRRPATVSLNELSYYLFGDNVNQRGLIHDYIAEKYGEESVSKIMNNTYSVMKVLDNIFTKRNAEPMQESMYRYMYGQYISVRSTNPLSSDEIKMYDYNYYKTYSVNGKNTFINYDGVKSSDAYEKRGIIDEADYVFDWVNGIRVNRDTIVGNDILENLFNEENVHTGAPVEFRIADVKIEVNGQTIHARDLATKVANGEIGDLSTLELGDIPIDIFDGEGNKIGHLKTRTDVIDAAKNVYLPNTTKIVNGESVNAERHELQQAVNNRLAVIYQLSKNGNIASGVKSTIDRVGVGRARTNGTIDLVRNKIRVPGSKLIIAKSDADNILDTKLYERGANEFRGVIHNVGILDKLVNGIPYIAIPVGTQRNAINPLDNGQPIYMIMPLQSTRIGDMRNANLATNDSGVHFERYDGKDTNGNPTTSNIELLDQTIGERVKMSIITAIDINIKVVTGKPLTDPEITIKEKLVEKGYDIGSHIGLQNYISEFTHTYQNDAVDISISDDESISIDNIIINRIKDANYSVVRITPRKIEIAKVDNHIGHIVTIFMKDGKASYASYTIKNNEDNSRRNYEPLTKKGFKDKVMYDIYDALDKAFLRIDAEKINTTKPHIVPLVNLKNANEATVVTNGNRNNVYYRTVVDEDAPIQTNGIDFKNYDEYAKSILKTDIETDRLGSKEVYTRNKAVHVNTKSIEESVAGKEFEEFRNKVVEASKKNTEKDLKVIGKFKLTDIINHRNMPGGKFNILYNTVHDAFVDYFNLNLDTDGKLHIVDKEDGHKLIVDFNGTSEDVEPSKFVAQLQKAFRESRNSTDIVTVSSIDSDLIARSPVRKEEASSSQQADEPVVGKVDVSKEVNSNLINPAVDDRQQIVLNNFAKSVESGIDVESIYNTYVNLLGMEDVAIEDAQEMLDDIINKVNRNDNEKPKFTLAVTAREKVEIADNTVKAIVEKSGILDTDGNYITIRTQDRAMNLANKLRGELADTNYDVIVFETSNNPSTQAYKVIVMPREEHTEIFGDSYVTMVNAINENKGFIPFVSPVVVNSVRKNIANKFLEVLVNTRNAKGSVNEKMDEIVAKWQAKLNSINQTIETKALDNSDPRIVELLNRDRLMFESLIKYSGDIKDMAIRGLISRNLVKYNAASGKVLVKSVDTSLLTGDLNMNDYDSNSQDEVEAEDQDTDDFDYNDNDFDVENTSNFDGDTLSTNLKNNASATIKRFLMGIKNVKLSKNGKPIVIKDAVGEDEVLDYEDVYNMLLRQFANRPQNIYSVRRIMNDLAKSNPVYAQILERFEAEYANPKSAVPVEFVKLVNKTRVNMTYSWINSSKLTKQGGTINQLASSNKGNVRNVIMDQWQAHFINNPRFTKVLNDGSIIVERERIEDHIHNYSFDSATFSKLLKGINTLDKTSPNYIKAVNKLIDAYNTQLKESRERVAKEIAARNNNPARIVNGEAAYKIFSEYSNVESVADVAALTGAMRSNVKSFIKAYCNTMGLHISDDVIDYTFNSHNGSRKATSIVDLFLKGNKSNITAVFKKLSEFGTDDDLSVNNIEPKIRGAVAAILNLEARFNKGVDPDTYRDKANKSVYSYTNYKYIDEVLAELHETPDLAAEIRSTAFGSKCYLLDDLMSKIENNANNLTNNGTSVSYDYSNDIRFTYADSIVVQGKHGKVKSVKVDQASEGDLELYKLMSFYNRGNKEGIFFYPTLSDGKSVMMLSMTRFNASFNTGSKGAESLSMSSINHAFELIVMPEIRRIMAAARAGKTDIKAFDEGSKHFILNNYLDGILDTYRKSESKDILAAEPVITAKAKKAFGKYLNKAIEAKIESWRNSGIVIEDNGKSIVRFVDNNMTKNQYYEREAFRIAADFEINNMIFNMGVNQIFMGDTATYWNKTVDGTIDNMSKRLAGHRGPGEVGVTATRDEAVKVVTAKDVELKSAAHEYLNSVKSMKDLINATDGQELTSLYEDMYNRMTYNGISRALFNALYHDNDAVIYKAFEEMFAKDGDENLNYDDRIKDHLKAKDMDLYHEYIRMTNQPVKPMYFSTRTKEFNGEKIRSAVYIKSSSFPLRPSLTQGMAIDKLRKAMDYGTYKYLEALRNGNITKEQAKEARAKMIDRIAFSSAVKLGASTNESMVSPESLQGFEEKGYEGLYETLNTAGEVLPRKGFRIQQDLPFDPAKEKIGVGSQERKLIFNGLLTIKELKGLKDEYDALYTQLYKKGYEDLLEELTVVKNGERVTDYSKLSEIAIKEGLTRNYDDNDIAELRTNLDGTGLESKIMFHRKDGSIEALMLSIVNSRVVKMKFPGRSFVLGTEAGFKLNSDIKAASGIVYTNKFKGELKSHGFVATKEFTTADGHTYKVDDYIKVDHINKDNESNFRYQPDQIIIPSFFKDADGKLIDLKDKYNEKTGEGTFVRTVDGKLQLKEEMFDEDILKAFGFRIPTQGHSSMASMEVVGFSDYKVGELVIAPKDFVHRMGSDFDIDKLYMYRFGIELKDGKFSKSSKYKDVNDIIDIHHKVFSTPDATVQRAIASPLSYGFFNQEYNPSEELEGLYKEKSKGDDKFYLGEFIESLYGEDSNSLSPLSSTYQSNFYHKGKMGKTGIAMFSSRSVVNAILQQAHYKMEGREIGLAMGKTSTKGAFDPNAYNFKIGNAEFNGINFGNNKVIGTDAFTIADVISWYQSTAVDNAKLNKLHKLNINNATMDVVNFMNQAGFHEQALWFINQPIIREYAAMTNARDGLLAKPAGYESVTEKLRAKYKAGLLKAYNKSDKKKVVGNSENVDKDSKVYNFRANPEFVGYRDSLLSMAEQIQSYSKNKEVINNKDASELTDDQTKFFGTQLAILEEFIDLKENQARLFRKAASVLNTDSKGLGASVAELADKRTKLLNVVGETTSTFANFDKIIGTIVSDEAFATLEDKEGFVKIGDQHFKPDGVVGSAVVYSVAGFEQVFGEQFIQFSDAYANAIDTVSSNASNFEMSDAKRKELGAKLIDNYKKFAHAYALAKIGIDIEKEYVKLLVDEFYVIKGDTEESNKYVPSKLSIASIVQELQAGRYSQDPLIASMVAVAGNNSRLASLNFNNIAGNSDTDGKVVTSIYNLISNNPVLIERREDNGKPYTGRELIKDLFLYSELTGGIQRFGELVKFMPHEMKKQIGFTEALNDVTNVKGIDNRSYLAQFVQHNPDYAFKIDLSDDVKGWSKAATIDFETTTDNEGREVINIVLQAHVKGERFDTILVDPFAYKVNEKGTTGAFLRNGEVIGDRDIIKTVYTDKKGVVNESLYKLLLMSDIDNGKDGLNLKGDVDYTPFTYNGQLVYRKVDELGNGAKTEYDPSVTVISSKMSALNKSVKAKYHKVFDADSTIVANPDNAVEFVFRDFSKAAVAVALNNAAKDDNTNVVARVMANMHIAYGTLDRVTVLSQNALKEEELEGATEFRAGLIRDARGSGNPMFFKYDKAENRGYIVVNENSYKGEVGNSARINRDFIHELGHMVLDSNRKNLSKLGEGDNYVSRFAKQGNALVAEAIEYLSNKKHGAWQHDIPLVEVLDKLRAMAEGKKVTVPNNNESAFLKEYRKYYGLISFDEFYSELSSNDEFITLLSSIPSKQSRKSGNSDVIDSATGYGSSIFGVFIEAFKKFFNAICKQVFANIATNVRLANNSIAEVALYEFVVGANVMNKSTGSLDYNKLMSFAKGVVVNKSNELPDDFEGKVEAAPIVKKDSSALPDDWGFDDEGTEDNAAKNTLATGDDYEYVRNENKDDIVDNDKVDSILRKLVSNDRLEYACKL